MVLSAKMASFCAGKMEPNICKKLLKWTECLYRLKKASVFFVVCVIFTDVLSVYNCLHLERCNILFSSVSPLCIMSCFKFSSVPLICWFSYTMLQKHLTKIWRQIKCKHNVKSSNSNHKVCKYLLWCFVWNSLSCYCFGSYKRGAHPVLHIYRADSIHVTLELLSRSQHSTKFPAALA